MSGVAKAVLNSKKTVMQRFKKLYRTLFIQFIRKDIMHKEDLQKVIEDLNKRIDQLESLTNAGFKYIDSAIQLAVLSHIHVGNLAAPTGPGTATGPIPPSAPIVTGPLGAAVVALSKSEPILNKRFSEEIGKGPAEAPFSDIFDRAAVGANFGAIADILVGEAGGET